jgi:nucleotide-binding universal stress UspA family protein
MQRFKNILFVNEPGTSKTSTPRAVVELARRNGARLTLCDVAYELARSFTQLGKSLEDLRRQRLDAMLEHVDTSGMEIERVLLTGAPFVEIIRQVQRGGHDLVIKNGEPGGLSEKSFGANDMHLMRKCPVPLWIAQSDSFGAYRSIVAAVDVDPDIPANEELNRLILDLATSLARQSHCALHIAHASWVHNEGFLKGLSSAAGEAIKTMETEREAALTALLEQRDMSDIEYDVIMGRKRPADHVLEVASRMNADLVVMGTVARTGIPGFFIGNNAERILSRLKCSALTVKPVGFSSPVA